MRILLPALLGAILTILGEVGLAFSLVDTAEADVATDVGSFERAFSTLGATIDGFFSGLRTPNSD